MVLTPIRWPDWSFRRDCGVVPCRQLSIVAAQSNRSHKSAACPNFPTIVGAPEWVFPLGALDRPQQLILPTPSVRRTCKHPLVHQSRHEHGLRTVGDPHATMDPEICAGCG